MSGPPGDVQGQWAHTVPRGQWAQGGHREGEGTGRGRAQGGGGLAYMLDGGRGLGLGEFGVFVGDRALAVSPPVPSGIEPCAGLVRLSVGTGRPDAPKR